MPPFALRPGRPGPRKTPRIVSLHGVHRNHRDRVESNRLATLAIYKVADLSHLRGGCSRVNDGGLATMRRTRNHLGKRIAQTSCVDPPGLLVKRSLRRDQPPLKSSPHLPANVACKALHPALSTSSGVARFTEPGHPLLPRRVPTATTPRPSTANAVITVPGQSHPGW